MKPSVCKETVALAPGWCPPVTLSLGSTTLHVRGERAVDIYVVDLGNARHKACAVKLYSGSNYSYHFRVYHHAILLIVNNPNILTS